MRVNKYALDNRSAPRPKAGAKDQAKHKGRVLRPNRAGYEFLAHVSHDLRTPIHSIIGFSQLLQDSLMCPSADVAQALQQIQESGRYLLDMANGALDLARVEAGAQTLKLEDVTLEDGLIAECLAMIRTAADKKNIVIHFARIGKHVVHADRILLKRVLLNLLANAVKYNRAGGSITLDCMTGSAGFVRLSVTDTGMGIPEEQQSRVFQPFQRMHRHNTVEDGTGIGLTISKHLIEFMGGVMGFTSTSGVGSTFWFELQPGRGMEAAASCSDTITAARGKPA